MTHYKKYIQFYIKSLFAKACCGDVFVQFLIPLLNSLPVLKHMNDKMIYKTVFDMLF